MRKVISTLVAVALLFPVVAFAQRKAPYWASIGAGQARMRSGPGRQFPAIWLYQRAGLPVKVVEVYPHWRKVEDPDGTTGWMQATLLDERRTAVVSGAIREMRASAAPDAAVVWRAEPGVIGTLKECARGWCLFDVKGRVGYIEIAHIWGAAPDERLP